MYALAEYSEGESLFYIISPRDVVVAKERDQDDHIDWLLEKKKYEVIFTTFFPSHFFRFWSCGSIVNLARPFELNSFCSSSHYLNDCEGRCWPCISLSSLWRVDFLLERLIWMALKWDRWTKQCEYCHQYQIWNVLAVTKNY